MKYFLEIKGVRLQILVWCKTNPTPMCNGNWLPDVEYCLLFKGEGAPRYNDGYSIKSKFYLSKKEQEKSEFLHPTIKPLQMVKNHILHSTQEGDIVLDTFVGSGTTCVACKETNRRYIGMELNEDYYKIACNRLNGINAIGQTSIFTDFERLSNVELPDDGRETFKEDYE